MKYFLLIAVMAVAPFFTQDKPTLAALLGVCGYFMIRWAIREEIDEKFDELSATVQENNQLLTDLTEKWETFIEKAGTKFGFEDLSTDSVDESENGNLDHKLELASALTGETKEMRVALFYPEGHEKKLDEVYKKITEAISRHGIKVSLVCAVKTSYKFTGKMDYSVMAEACKKNKAATSVVLAPPAGSSVSEGDFSDLLSVTMMVQGISSVIIKWGDQDHNFLNHALDLALTRLREDKKAA